MRNGARRSILIASILMVMVTLPGSVAAKGPEPVPNGQTVGLEIVYLPPGVKVREPKPGDITINNTVSGNCGWASMWVYDVGVETARFDADAGSSQGPIVRADWYIDWSNNDTGLNGAFWGTTTQFSPTWGVKRQGWVDSGLVFGKLTTLVVTLYNGTVCQGLAPWDWEQVN